LLLQLEETRGVGGVIGGGVTSEAEKMGFLLELNLAYFTVHDTKKRIGHKNESLVGDSLIA
jgi:hypothetical protein